MAQKNELMTTPAPTITVLPPSQVSEAKQLLPVENFQRLPFWEKMEKSEQKQLIHNSSGLSANLIANAMSSFAIGYYLAQIQQQLLPYRGAFTYFLNHQFNAKVARTAYRHIDSYKRIAQYLSEPALKVAAARGVRFFAATEKRPLGKHTEAFELLSSNGEKPPKSDDPQVVNRWWDKLERTTKEIEADPRKKATISRKLEKKLALEFETAASDPQSKQRDAYRLVRSALKELTASEKMAWLDDFIGYLMTEAGIHSKKTFTPVAIPEDYRQGRGRPRLNPQLVVTESLAATA
jgi:hypothetical protein